MSAQALRSAVSMSPAASSMPGPTVSLVVVGAPEGVRPGAFLSSLVRACGSDDVEIIFVSETEVTAPAGADRARILTAPVGSSQAGRGLGMRYAKGDVVMLLDGARLDSEQALASALAAMPRSLAT